MKNQQINILIIDSKPATISLAQQILESNPLVSLVEHVTDTDKALLSIINTYPDIVLMEYPAKGKSEKELIHFLKNKLTETLLVFVSHDKKNAANAIRNGVFDYLIKPVTPEDLGRIIEKAQWIKRNNIQARINQIIEKTPEETKLTVQTLKGYIIIDPQNILYCKVSGVYAEVIFVGNRKEMSHLTLLRLEELLKPYNFIRINRSTLVNQHHIRKINKSNSTIVLSVDGEETIFKASRLCVKNLSNFDTE